MEPRWRRAVLPALAILLGTVAAMLGPVFGAVLGFVVASFFLVVFPPVGIAMLVAARSSLDYFQEVSIVPGPMPINPASALGMGLVLLAFVVLVLKVRARSPIDWGGRIGALWAFWLGVSAFALVVGYLRFGGGVAVDGVKEWVRLGSVYALYLLIANLTGRFRSSPRWLLWGCFIGLIVPCLFGAYQVATGSATHNVQGIRRVIGTFGHPNPFGVYLAGLSFLGLGYLFDLRSRPVQRSILLVLVGGAFTMLLFTYSRSALGIVLGALLVWAAWGSARRRVLVLGGIGIAIVLLFPAIAWRFEDLFVDIGRESVSGEDVGNSFAWRLLNYQRLLGEFRESPIIGQGLTAIAEINPTQSKTAEGFDTGFAAHNEVVRVLVEQGALGFIAWVFVAFGIWKAIGDLAARQGEWGVPRTGEALRALFLTLVLLSGVGMGFLNQTVLLYVIFTIFGALRVGARPSVVAPEPTR
ncbi:MAG: O-antigen ligase family protein [Candidatus Eisenbacteria bacterium]